MGSENEIRPVDFDIGTVDRSVYVDEEYYKLEQDRIFTKTWLFIGHESQLEKPGDYFASRMGEESVVCVKDRAGEIHVFLNSCRHRGMKVCRYDDGNTPIFTCPYHGWSYGLNGKLVGVPYFKEAYHEKLDKSEWGLIAARVDQYKGSIWATWDDAIPPLLDYLGKMTIYLDALLDSTSGIPGGAQVLSGVQKWIVPCNWKFRAENSSGDPYHAVSHTSVALVGRGPGGRAGRDAPSYRVSGTSFPSLGHAFRGSPVRSINEDVYPFPFFNEPEVDAYFQQQHQLRQKADVPPPAWLFGGGGNIFPHMGFSLGFPCGITVAHPRSPHSAEIWRWYLVDKEAPMNVKAFLRNYLVRVEGPAGMTEQDDMENWNLATNASLGVVARRHPYNYQIGLGFTHDEPEMPGAVVSDAKMSEQSALTFYRRWSALMNTNDRSD